MFNPRDLVRAPYWDCPYCKKVGTFGTFMVGGHSYIRRCKACWAHQHFELPEFNPTVLYLDQFFLSNVMRVLDPTTSPERIARLGEQASFYRGAFEKIHRLCKLHLLVCPTSPVQYEESVVSPEFRKLKRLWELLSHGARLPDPDSVRNSQVLRYARTWLGLSEDVAPITRRNVIQGDYLDWKDWFQVTLNVGIIDGLPDDLRDERAGQHDAYRSVYDRWAAENHRSFEYWLTEERKGLSGSLKAILNRRIARELQIQLGRAERTVDDFYALCGRHFQLLMALDKVFEEAGVPRDNRYEKMWKCLEAEELISLPYVKITCHLFAALAQRAAQGQKFPDKTPFNDVSAIGAYLPYCDALFVDKEMEALLKEKRLRQNLSFDCAVFSLRRKADFLGYLDDIERNAAPSHMDTVREVYGDEWADPYVEVLSDLSARETDSQ